MRGRKWLVVVIVAVALLSAVLLIANRTLTFGRQRTCSGGSLARSNWKKAPPAMVLLKTLPRAM